MLVLAVLVSVASPRVVAGCPIIIIVTAALRDSNRRDTRMCGVNFKVHLVHLQSKLSVGSFFFSCLTVTCHAIGQEENYITITSLPPSPNYEWTKIFQRGKRVLGESTRKERTQACRAAFHSTLMAEHRLEKQHWNPSQAVYDLSRASVMLRQLHRMFRPEFFGKPAEAAASDTRMFL